MSDTETNDGRTFPYLCSPAFYLLTGAQQGTDIRHVHVLRTCASTGEVREK